jgi:transitional endoplasmic reticulum ATPase
MTWHIRDFAPEDLEAAIRLDVASSTTTERPLFDASDVVTSLHARHPAVVAVGRGSVVGVAFSRVDTDRLGVAAIASPGVARKGLRQQPAVRSGKSSSQPRGPSHHRTAPRRRDRHRDLYQLRIQPARRHRPLRQARSRVAALCGTPSPARRYRATAGQWQQIAGMVQEKTLIERRIVLPLSRPAEAADHGVVPPHAIVLFGPPGTGKTTFARGIASRLGWPFVELFPRSWPATTVGFPQGSARHSDNSTNSITSSPSSTRSKK